MLMTLRLSDCGEITSNFKVSIKTLFDIIESFEEKNVPYNLPVEKSREF